MLRRMMNFKKAEGDDVESFMRRTNKAISNMMCRHFVVPWDVYARRCIFRWA